MKQYTEEEIQEIERELDRQVDEEDDLLSGIEELAEKITKKLMKTNHVREEFMGTTFIFSVAADRTARKVTLLRTDPIKLNLAGSRYRPAIFTSEWDDDYTYFENIYVVVKAALCSKAGIINIEEN